MMPTDAGACGTGLASLYRLYNNAPERAPNHRYTTSRALRAETIARGWTAAGQGLGAIGCVPAQ